MAMAEVRSVIDVARAYWRIYGGLRSVLHSPYLWCSLVIAVISHNFWSQTGWWSSPLGVLPNLLGFSVGAFAIFLAFGDEQFRRIIAGQDPDTQEEASPYLRFCSTFMHFIAVQLAALMIALVCQSTPFAGMVMPAWGMNVLSICRNIAWFIGYLLFLYSLLLCFATAASIFRVARQYDNYITMLKKRRISASQMIQTNSTAASGSSESSDQQPTRSAKSTDEAL